MCCQLNKDESDVGCLPVDVIRRNVFNEFVNDISCVFISIFLFICLNCMFILSLLCVYCLHCIVCLICFCHYFIMRATTYDEIKFMSNIS